MISPVVRLHISAEGSYTAEFLPTSKLSKCKGTALDISLISFFEKLNKDINNINLTLRVNGELRQNGNTKNMIFNVSFLISHISKYLIFLKSY